MKPNPTANRQLIKMCIVRSGSITRSRMSLSSSGGSTKAGAPFEETATFTSATYGLTVRSACQYKWIPRFVLGMSASNGRGVGTSGIDEDRAKVPAARVLGTCSLLSFCSCATDCFMFEKNVVEALLKQRTNRLSHASFFTVIIGRH